MDLSKKAVTCIDIGTDAIKLLSGFIAPEEGRVQVQKSVYKAFSAGSYHKYGDIRQIEALTELLNQEKIFDEVYLCLSNPKYPLYQISLPDTPVSELPEAIKSELIQKKIFDPLTCYYGYMASRINYEKSFVQLKTFLAYRPKEEIQKFLQIFERHKIKVHCFEHPDMILINGMQKMGYFPTDKAYLILSLGASTCSFMVVYSNQLVFERKLSSTGEVFTKTVADSCKLDLESSEKLKKENGIALDQLSDELVEAHHILISSVEKLISDLEYSMTYFFFQETKARVKSFEKAFLTGGNASMPGLKEFIQDRIGVDCVLLDLKDKMVLPEGFAIPYNKTPDSIFSTALGLFYWEAKNLNNTCHSIFSNVHKRSIFSILEQTLKYGVGSFLFLFLFFFVWYYWGR